MISVRVEIEPIKDEDYYSFIDKIHTVFARRILEEAKKATPVESGELRDSWNSVREDVHTSYVFIHQTNDGAAWDLPGVGKADWLWRGTGVWGPKNQPYCGKRIQPVTDWREPIRIKPMAWRDKHTGLWVRKSCVRGINPRAIKGSIGMYDFAKDIENAVFTGVESAIQELNE